MPTANMIQAINGALKLEMDRDDRVVVLGEDVGAAGGVFRTTEGLQDAHGAERVIDTPLAESGIVGTAVGMALYGLRPVAEIQFMDFIYPGFDQIVSEAAKFRYRSGGQFTVPLTIRTPYGGGIRGGHYHSQSTEAYFCHTPGLKVVVPSTPHDAKGLLLSAIRDPDPVLFLEPKRIYRSAKGEVPDDDYAIPLGEADVRREGADVTLVAWGAMMTEALEAAERVADEKGIEAEVLDLRTLLPLDVDALLDSVRKTGRLVVLHEATKYCGLGAELSAIVAEKAVLYLEAPIERVAGYDTPFPYTLEDEYMPSTERVARALVETVEF